ncbi:MAG: type II and III secretion system protein [Cyanobacterium sp. T60_A2020_053]|nr:type II and III secretion system protein [Cyanobacterium sp. T60_A2020_053]
MSLFSRQQIRLLSSTSLLLLGLQSGVVASEEQLKVGISPQGLDKLILAQNADVLVPNPEMSIDGKPVPNIPVPPNFRRPVAPPVGDMAVSNRQGNNQDIIFPNDVRIDRILLLNKRLDEVMAILARAGNLNILFDYGVVTGTAREVTENRQEDKARNAQLGVTADAQRNVNVTTNGNRVSQNAQGDLDGNVNVSTNAVGRQNETSQVQLNERAISPLERPITLELEDVSAQETFNNLLKIYRLQASLNNNTIFVGANLSPTLQNTVSKSIRLNQYSVANAARFLNTMGASGTILTGGTTVGETEIPELSVLQLPEPQNPIGIFVLKGLNLYADPIHNTIILMGSQRLVDQGVSYLTQLDLRRRQVAVNVRIVDISLGNDKSFGADFSFGVDNTSIDQTGGSLLLNFLTGAQGANLTRDFAARIQTTIATGNGKILTDPTLIVQEGQTAQIKLTQEVFGGFQQQQETVDGVTTITREPIIKDAGITLDLDVNKIDDNGFVTVNLRPIISGIAGSQNTAEGLITLTQERSLESGLIRLRDGQTLVLSGIIQDTDRATVSKVPILGDLPLLGSLFRFTNNVNERNEVIVLVTPNILDDSETNSGFGYNYNPSRQTQEFLQEKGVNIPGSGFEATPQQ